jgi:hypothetical protein
MGRKSIKSDKKIDIMRGLHYIENAQENKKNTILAYNIANDSKRIKKMRKKCVCVCVCVCVWMLDGDWLVH